MSMNEISTNKMLDYKQRAKYSRDRAANSAAAKMLRNKNGFHSTDTSDELKTMDKRTKGLKTFDRVAARKFRDAMSKEDTSKSADNKPQNFVAPDGKLHVRMVSAKPRQQDKVNELKKSTLANYIKKASDDRTKNAYDVGKSGEINFKGLKRRQGINRAVNKLTKEDVQIDEDSKYYKSTNHEDAANAHMDLGHNYKNSKQKGSAEVAKHHMAASDAHHKAHEFIVKGKHEEAHRMAQAAKAHAAKAVEAAKKQGLNSRKSALASQDSAAAHKAHAHLKEEKINEKLSVGDGMSAWISDFKKSDAPQFKGKSDKERRDMAIAAYLSTKRGK